MATVRYLLAHPRERKEAPSSLEALVLLLWIGAVLYAGAAVVLHRHHKRGGASSSLPRKIVKMNPPNTTTTTDADLAHACARVLATAEPAAWGALANAELTPREGALVAALAHAKLAFVYLHPREHTPTIDAAAAHVFPDYPSLANVPLKDFVAFARRTARGCA